MRRQISRDDWAEFTEIEGYFKARGETLLAIAKLSDSLFRICVYGTGAYLGRISRDGNRNIINIETVGIPTASIGDAHVEA